MLLAACLCCSLLPSRSGLPERLIETVNCAAAEACGLETWIVDNELRRRETQFVSADDLN